MATIWSDVNSNVLQNGKPLLVTNLDAIQNGIYNILRCPLGARLWNREFGSILPFLLWENISKSIALRMEVGAIEAIKRWEPRVNPIPSLTVIQPSTAVVGYDLQVGYQIVASGTVGNLSFTWIKS